MGWLNDVVKSVLNPGAKDVVNDRARKAANEAYRASQSGGGGQSDTIGTAITDNAQLIQQREREAAEAAQNSQYGSNGGTGTDGGGGVTGGTGTTGTIGTTGTTGKTQVKSTMSKAERDKLYKMKDSNVPYYYDHDENDLLYMAASEKKDYMWGLKEEIFVYTMHDRQKHRYITSLSIDSDADDICTTCQIDMPYKPELMEYYIPGKTVFMVIGGTFDREVLFVGRVSEINQLGDSIQVTGQNIGWKFKQYMTQEFYEKIQGLPVPLVVKAIFKELGFTEGKYIMDLWAIPKVFKYKLDENGTIKFKGETVENVPELKDVVKRLKKADINEYVATKAKLKSTEANAKAYETSKEKRTLSAVYESSTSGYSSSYRKPYGIKTSIKGNEVSYDPIEEMIFGKDTTPEYFSNDASGDSEYKYEDIMNNIGAAIDAQFFIVDTTVCFVSFNSLMAMSSSEAIVKSVQPRIESWQLQDDSFELDVNQYGYYNTVIIKYKNGTLKRSFDDLVRVYSEIPVTYEDKELDYEGAQLKAQALLSAHVRDFGMQVRFTILYTGKITVASFVKVQNPLTMSESLLYVYGISVRWSAEGQTLTCDMDCRYGPENPDNPEIPEVGLGYTGGSQSSSGVYTGNVPADVAQAAKMICGNLTDPTAKGAAIYNWVDQNVTYKFYYESEHSPTEVLQGKIANCWDTAMLIYEMCTAVGVKCEVHNGTFTFSSGSTYGHLWNKIEQNGQMVFADTGRTNQNPLGQMNGTIQSDSLMQKNY